MNNFRNCEMYKMNPLVCVSDKIELPNNMYHLRRIDASGENCGTVLSGIQDKVKKILKMSADGTDLENRWDRVLEDLHSLAVQLQNIRKSIDGSNTNQLTLLDGAAIYANPNNPPYSLLLLQKIYKEKINLKITGHVHSSVSLSVNFEDFERSFNENGKIDVHLIWKEGLLDTQLVLNPLKQQSILGEINILRFIARLGLEMGYDENTEFVIDAILDECHRISHLKKGANLSKLSSTLGNNEYFGGKNLNMADIAVWSIMKSSNLKPSENLTKWLSSIDRIVQ